MNIFKRLMSAIYARHWVHKGELVTHLTYLSATFFGSHGIAASAAGVLAIIILLGLAVSHATE